MFHFAEFVFLVPLLIWTGAPFIIGVTYVRKDADRRGQPGWLWALLTIPLGWIAILGYMIARSLDTRTTPER
jgi:hypothetical protein